MTTTPNPIQVTHCGCCECYHRVDYFGDCRNDAERFPTVEEAEEMLGQPVEEVCDADYAG